MTTKTQQPFRCTRCGAPLTFAIWFSDCCPADGGFGLVGHVPPIPGPLLPLALDPESVREP